MNHLQRSSLELVLAELRMAYDLRNSGYPEAAEYERNARRALAHVLGVPYDAMRGEASKAGEGI